MPRTMAHAAPGHPPPHRDGRARMSAARLSIAWLAVFLFILRAFMPTGFMPDPAALREGHFRIVYCAGAGPMPPGMAMDGQRGREAPHRAAGARAQSAMAAGTDHHGMADAGPGPTMAPAHGHASMDGKDGQAPHAPAQSGMADCLFGLSSVHAYPSPVLAAWAPLLALAWHMPAAATAAAPSSGVIAGPPVGSRAPPYRLD